MADKAAGQAGRLGRAAHMEARWALDALPGRAEGSALRRRKLLVALAGLVVPGVAGAVAVWPPTNKIINENFKRIHRGMTKTQGEEILGPPGEYTTGPLKLQGDSDTIDSLETEVLDALASRRLWISDSACAELTFDDENRVARVEQASLVPAPRS